MKTLIKAALLGLALGATGAFAQAAYDTDSSGSRYYLAPWEASTMAPAQVEPRDIRNANSALWGVGG
jgi:hypothetical protein